MPVSHLSGGVRPCVLIAEQLVDHMSLCLSGRGQAESASRAALGEPGLHPGSVQLFPSERRNHVSRSSIDTLTDTSHYHVEVSRLSNQSSRSVCGNGVMRNRGGFWI